MRINGHICAIMRKRRRASAEHFPRKPAILRRFRRNLTLGWKTIEKFGKFAEIEVSKGHKRPDLSWFLEQGVDLYCRQKAAEHEELERAFAEIDAKYRRATSIPVFDREYAESTQVTAPTPHPELAPLASQPLSGGGSWSPTTRGPQDVLQERKKDLPQKD